jgi:plasmid stability protein
VRTTLTLDDDVAAKLKSRARRTGRPFREVVNDALRTGLAERPPGSSRSRFKVKARDFGALRPGLGLDNIGELLERTEGPHHR